MKLSNINKKVLMSSLKVCMVYLPAMVYKLFKPNIWLISERPGQARDNGFVFFKYIKKYRPNQISFYIIEKNSDDLKKFNSEDDVIYFDSLKHYFYFCASKIHISSHVGGCNPRGLLIWKIIKPILHYKDVFLPHGVSYGISEFCFRKFSKIDLFICSGKPEYDNVLANYGYKKHEVAYTGFPRLDIWHHIDVNKKQIVLMPTWRLYLAQNEDTIFESTTYFKAYKSLIENDELRAFLEDNGLHFVFYLHNDMRKYVDHFKTDCKNIEIVYKDETYDIQELLKSSAILITDYSSVHFDFSYMGKPVIYYQFDKEEFFDKQYKHSSFDAETDGFGPVGYTPEDIVSALKQAYHNEFKVEDIYHKRMRNFYRLYDEKNCERVYYAINKRINGIWK